MSRTTRDWSFKWAEFWSARPYCTWTTHARVSPRGSSKRLRRIGMHVERRQASAEIRREVASL